MLWRREMRWVASNIQMDLKSFNVPTLQEIHQHSPHEHPRDIKLGSWKINPANSAAAGDDSKRWSGIMMKMEARSATLINGVLQLKPEPIKPQAMKKAVTVLLRCQYHLISTEQISCANLTNLISFFFVQLVKISSALCIIQARDFLEGFVSKV